MAKKFRTGEEILSERKQNLSSGKSMTGDDILRSRGANIPSTPVDTTNNDLFNDLFNDSESSIKLKPANIKDDLDNIFNLESDHITPKKSTPTYTLPYVQKPENNVQYGAYGAWDNPTISQGTKGIGDYLSDAKDKLKAVIYSGLDTVTKPAERLTTRILYNDWSDNFENTPDEWKPADILSEEEKKNIQNHVLNNAKPGDTLESIKARYDDLIKQTKQSKIYNEDTQGLRNFLGYSGEGYKPEDDVLFSLPLLGDVSAKDFGDTAGGFANMVAATAITKNPFAGGFLAGALDSYGKGGSDEDILKSGIEMGTFNLVGGKVGKAVGGKVGELIQGSPLKNTVLGDLATKFSNGVAFGTAGTATEFLTSDDKPTANDFFRNALMGAMFEAIPATVSSIRNIPINQSRVFQGMKNYETEMKSNYADAKTAKNPKEASKLYDQMIERNEVVKQGLQQNKFTGASKEVKQAGKALDLINDMLIKEKGFIREYPEQNFPRRVQGSENATVALPEKTPVNIQQKNTPVENAPVKSENKLPMDDRTYENVSSRKVTAYQYEHPEVKDHIQTEAYRIMGELKNTVKGERFVTTNEQGETNITGVKKFTSPTIERIQKATNATYPEIGKALTGIINDHGTENTALAKKIELIIDDNLSSGVVNFQGEKLPADVDYLNKKGKIEGKTYTPPRSLTADEFPLPKGGYNGQPGKVVRNEENGSKEKEAQGENKDKNTIVAKNALESAVTRAKKEGIPEATAEIVEPKTHTQRQIKEVMEALGYDVQFYSSKSLPATEAFDPKNPNTILVRNNNKNDMLWAAGHGFFHGLKTNHPDLYKEVLDVLEDSITEDQLSKYISTFDKNPEYQKSFEGNRDAIIEEMLADEAGNTFIDKSFWEKVYEKSKELFSKLVDIVRDMFKKISGKEYSNYFTQRQIDKFRTKFEDVITEVRRRSGEGRTETKPSNEPVKFSMEKKPTEKKEPVKPFFSKLQKTIEEKMPKAAFVQDIRGIIKSAGIKPDEVKWSGIDTYLTSKIGSKITKKELIDFLKTNELKVEEVKKGDIDPEDGTIDTKFEQYTLPGGKNYRELLFTLPEKIPELPIGYAVKPVKLYYYEGEQYTLEYPDKTGHILYADNKSEAYSEAVKILQNKGIMPKPDEYSSSHWKESNVLAHTRFNDRTDEQGNKILFVEEIQSDWHQQGRKEGYMPKPLGKWEVFNAHTGETIKGFDTQSETENWVSDHMDEYGGLLDFAEAGKGSYGHKVPDAPFAKTWHEFVLKRLIRYAAENGYDKIAWTTGEQQAERYDLSKQVGSVQVYRNYKDGKPAESYQFFVVDQSGHTLDGLTRGNATQEQITEMFGKDLGSRLIDGADKAKGHRYEVSGNGLKIGGEGMKGFYDKIVPEFLNKYLKKWGVKVGTTNISLDSPPNVSVDIFGLSEKNKTVSQPAFDITPEMVNSVMTEGQPLFSMRRREVRKRIANDVDMPGILEKADTWRDRPVVAMARETPERVIEAVAGKDAPEIIEKFIAPIKKNEASKIRWQKKERQSLHALGIKPRSKESEFCQKYGEGEYVTINKVIEVQTGKEVEKATVQKYTLYDLKKDLPNSWQKVKKAAEVLRRKYDSYIDEINKVLTENGYDPMPKRNDYFMHFQEVGSILERFGVPVNINNLPTSINGITDDFLPGKNFFAQALPRTGKRTTYDAIQGIDKYLNGAGNIIYHTEDVQRLRALQQAIREKYSAANIMEKASDLKQQMIDKDEYKQKWAEVENLINLGNGHLSNFAAWLTEYTNQLAGKKARIDRALVEAVFGRVAYGVFDKLRKQVGANMVGANISSALTNFIPLTQSMATTQKRYFVKAMIDTMANAFRNDGFVEKSDYLTRRFGSEMLSMPLWDKIGDKAGFLFKWVDQFVSQTVVRGKYLELISKGYNHDAAIKKADDWAARMMADRSMGATPNLFGSKALGIFTQFQLEVNNQLSFIFKDVKNNNYASDAKGIKKNIADKSPKFYNAAAAASAIAQIFIFGFLFNLIFEKLSGRKPALDPIDIAQSSFKNYTNPKLTTGEANKKLIEKIANQLPFVSTLTGGRIPLEAAVPNPFAPVTGESTWGKEAVKPLTYLLPPTGGGQVKKTIEGISAMNEKSPGVYGGKEGDSLKFPIEDDPLNRIRAAIFGKWSSPESVKYFENNEKPLTADQTALLTDANLKSKDTVTAYEAIIKYRDRNAEIDKKHKEFSDDPSKLDVMSEATYKAFNTVESSIEKIRKAIEEVKKINPDDKSVSDLSKVIIDQYKTANNLYDMLNKK